LKDDGLLVFTFHHGSPEAWDALTRALGEAGFGIVRLWPVHAEMDVGVPVFGKRGIRFDSILVCRKSSTIAPPPDIIQNASNLTQWIRKEATALMEKLEPQFTLTKEERISLFQGIAAMLFTQGRTDLLPSALQFNWGD